MAEKALRKGQRVFAADGTYLGRLLQCDARFMVIGNSRWKPDHWIVPNEEVAAAATEVVVLRSVPAEILPETSAPWWPARDRLGNADGVDLEPLRAGMSELEDREFGTRRSVPDVPTSAAHHREPLPSADDAEALDRERVARLDARTEKLLSAEVEDLELGAPVALPAALAGAALHGDAFAVEPLDPMPAAPETSVHPIPTPAVVHVDAPPGEPILSAAGEEASRTPRRLERLLRAAGLSVSEAQAIAAEGFRGLATLHRGGSG